MRPKRLAVLTMLSLAAAPVLADEPQDKPAIEAKVVAPRPADSDAPLPVGFPGATAPGVIEVKTYPAYRSAVARSTTMSMSSSDFLFWPLFNHIEKNHIAMTAPVINTYATPEMIETPGAKGEVSMEFLYREPTQGQPGPDGRLVEVVDHPSGRFVCLGYQGRMSDLAMRKGVERLREWLDQNQDTWEAAGPPRRLGYHGPMTPAAQRLWEVQIPIKPARNKDAKDQPAPVENAPTS